MAAGQGIKGHSTGILPGEEVGPDLVFWVGVVDTQVFDPGSKSLIQPEVGPPLHCGLGERSHDSHVTCDAEHMTNM